MTVSRDCPDSRFNFVRLQMRTTVTGFYGDGTVVATNDLLTKAVTNFTSELGPNLRRVKDELLDQLERQHLRTRFSTYPFGTCSFDYGSLIFLFLYFPFGPNKPFEDCCSIPRYMNKFEYIVGRKRFKFWVGKHCLGSVIGGVNECDTH